MGVIREYGFLALPKIRPGKGNVELSRSDLQYLYTGIQGMPGNEPNALSSHSKSDSGCQAPVC
jgi:hypothetical protein